MKIKAVVHKVLSATSFILKKDDGEEIHFSLSDVGNTPKVGFADRVDEPYSFLGREFVRTRLIGKVVYYEVTGQNDSHYFGIILLGDDRRLAEHVLAAGYTQIKVPDYMLENERILPLVEAENEAKSKKCGIWSEKNPNTAVRKMKYVLSTRECKELLGVTTRCVVEQIISPNFVRIMFKDPSTKGFHFIETAVNIAGISSGPMRRNETPDVHTKTAFDYLNDKMLHRDFQITFVKFDTNRNGLFAFYPSPAWETILAKGLVRIDDYTVGLIPDYSNSLRLSEKQGQTKKLGVWQNYEPSAHINTAECECVVHEIVSGDLFRLGYPDGTIRLFSLANVRAPAMGSSKKEPERLAWEAREFMRHRLIGKKVMAFTEFSRSIFDEDVGCGYLELNGKNMSVEGVKEGLLKVMHSKQGHPRTFCFDELLVAEIAAKDARLGLHLPEDKQPRYRFVDIVHKTGGRETIMAELRRYKKMKGIVERVLAPSRFRVTIPDRNVLCNLNLVEVRSNNDHTEEELAQISSYLLQKEIEIDVESMTKNGSLRGTLFFKNMNIALWLTEEGFVRVNNTDSVIASRLFVLEEQARKAKRGLWKRFVPVQPKIVEKEALYEITELNIVAADYLDSIYSVVPISVDLASGLVDCDELKKSTTFKMGEIVAVYVEETWSRGKIVDIVGGSVEVEFIDFYGKTTVAMSDLRHLPDELNIVHFKPCLKRYRLAFIHDEDGIDSYPGEFFELGEKTCVVLRNFDSKLPEIIIMEGKTLDESVNAKMARTGDVLIRTFKDKWIKEAKEAWEVIDSQCEIARSNGIGLYEFGDKYFEGDAL
eukprot:TRINITY_DN2830_c0_g1_i1.p1 TRINITY_DN2830_c0_g1~~TRINITY_DN2830_c0_g1_i1.p1  ORF type:complete len:833 (+),score=253.98 TRINITY_DN2830_c0_g1_i1:39-2501(+)